MKYIVTGGCGFIGSHLVEKIQSQMNSDDHIYIIDNLSTGRISNLKNINKKNITILEGAVEDLLITPPHEISNPDYIFHLAGLADIVPSIEKPQDYFKANVQATLALLEFIKQQKPIRKLVYAASSSCYGLAEIYPTPETAPIKPMYPYALTKHMGEELILHWAELYNIPSLSLRLFNVYGPRSRTNGTYGAVFGVFMAQILANKPLTVVGDGTQSRDFTYVSDVANAFWLASQSQYTNEVLNVGSGDHYSINKLVGLLNQKTCKIPKRPGEPDITFACTQKIKQLLKWNPEVSFEEGVNQVLENINDYKEAPVWDATSIDQETKSWFKFLSTNKEQTRK